MSKKRLWILLIAAFIILPIGTPEDAVVTVFFIKTLGWWGYVILSSTILLLLYHYLKGKTLKQKFKSFSLNTNQEKKRIVHWLYVNKEGIIVGALIGVALHWYLAYFAGTGLLQGVPRFTLSLWAVVTICTILGAVTDAIIEPNL